MVHDNSNILSHSNHECANMLLKYINLMTSKMSEVKEIILV